MYCKLAFLFISKILQLEDLLKVKGIDKMLLYHTSIFLTVDNIEDSSEGSEPRQKTILTSCHTMPDFIGT